MELKVNADRWIDCLEVAKGAAYNITNAGGTKVVLLTQAHESVYQCVDIWFQTKSRFVEGVTTTTRTGDFRAALSDLQSAPSSR